MIRATVPSIYATIKFQILSGSEVLWSSEIMKKNDPVSNFNVPIPKGVTVLYLLADQVDENHCDHGDWVNLEWVTDSSKLQTDATPNTPKKITVELLED